MARLNIGFMRDIGTAKWAYRTFLRQFSKRILRRDNLLLLPTGLEIRLPRNNHFGSEVFVTNADVDWGAEALFVRFLDPTGAFLDVGSHIGYYSLYVLPKVAHVYAFEPDPRNLPILESNLGRYANATIVKKAVSSTNGSARFVLQSESAISHLHRCGENPGELIQVETVTLDSFTDQMKWKVTGIKIDVEGFDLDVLKGAAKLMLRDSPLVLTEAQTSAELYDLVARNNYSIYAFTRDPNTRRVALQRVGSNAVSLTKMLFLVPGRLKRDFDAIARS